MIGLGWRREMADWDRHAVQADFFEVVPENWLRRDRAPLHALRAACNQSTNRDPVMDLDEREVRDGLSGLRAAELVEEGLE